MQPKTPPGPKVPWNMLVLYIFVAVAVVFALNDYLYVRKHVENLPYSQFLQYVDQGKVAQAIISNSKIYGELKNPDESKRTHFVTIAVKDDSLVKRLQDHQVVFKGEVENTFWSSVLGWVLPLAFFYVLWMFLFRRMGDSAGGILSMTKSKAKIYMERDTRTTFADVAGIDEARDELQEIIRFLQAPKHYARLGGRAPKGVLLVGPPGTGKTLLARALAGEAKVPFFSINGSEFVEMFVGLGAARVRDLFFQARKNAPCILFIDEIDALGKSRGLGLAGTGANDEKEQTLNQLLAEMDGFDFSEGVVILAATNRPEILDPALLRAGRFDRQILLNNPDRVGRIKILKVHLRKIHADPKLSVERIASLTSGFSGADLANLVNEAALLATRRNADQVEEIDFTQAIERIVAGLEHKSKILNPEEKRRIAYHEMGHVTVALANKDSLDKIHKVSIVPRGIGSLGYTLQRPTEDRYLMNENELLHRIATLLGGRASEKLFFNQVSTGAADDLVKATEIARAMITQFGMSEKLGLASFEQRSSAFLHVPGELMNRTPTSEATAEEIDAEIKALLDRAYRLALHSIEVHGHFVEEGVRRLLERETLDESELLDMWQQGEGPIPFQLRN